MEYEKNTSASIEGWDRMYKSGLNYGKVVHGVWKRPAVFTPSIVRNICARGIESYFIAIFRHRGILPRNHTMQDLCSDEVKLFPVNPELEAGMLKIDSRMQLCSLESFKGEKASGKDVQVFLKTLNMTAAIATGELDNFGQK